MRYPNSGTSWICGATISVLKADNVVQHHDSHIQLFCWVEYFFSFKHYIAILLVNLWFFFLLFPEEHFLFCFFHRLSEEFVYHFSTKLPTHLFIASLEVEIKSQLKAVKSTHTQYRILTYPHHFCVEGTQKTHTYPPLTCLFPKRHYSSKSYFSYLIIIILITFLVFKNSW